MIYMFLSNNPSSGDIKSSNLSCFFIYLFIYLLFKYQNLSLFDMKTPQRFAETSWSGSTGLSKQEAGYFQN